MIDSAGGETFAKALDIARPGARVVTYGGTTGDAKIRPFSIFWKHLDVLGTSMGSPDDFRGMLRLFEHPALEPAIDDIVDLAAVPAAAQRLLARRSVRQNRRACFALDERVVDEARRFGAESELRAHDPSDSVR